MFLHFADKSIPYRVFIQDVAAQLAYNLRQDNLDPEYISQNQAFRLFGRKQVERWRNSGKISPLRRGQRLEYRTADLRLLQRTQQDYGQ